MAKKSANPWPGRLKRLKDKLGLRTDDELAKRLGVSLQTIRSWKYRRKAPPRMAQHYINDLLND